MRQVRRKVDCVCLLLRIFRQRQIGSGRPEFSVESKMRLGRALYLPQLQKLQRFRKRLTANFQNPKQRAQRIFPLESCAGSFKDSREITRQFG